MESPLGLFKRSQAIVSIYLFRKDSIFICKNTFHNDHLSRLYFDFYCA